jgi:hypothetical protein
MMVMKIFIVEKHLEISYKEGSKESLFWGKGEVI